MSEGTQLPIPAARARAWLLTGLAFSVMAMAAGCPAKIVHRPYFGKAPTSGFTGKEPTIDLLVRGFLTRDGNPRRNFAYYTYLLFLDSGEASRADREAAVAAFVALLEDVHDVQSVPGFDPAHAAILYAPVRTLPTHHSPAEILSVYDYTTAQLIARRIERSGGTVPLVALVGAPAPLDAAAASVGMEVRIHNLTGDPAAAQARLRRFHSQLIHPGRSVTISQVLERARTFFDSVGAFLLIMKEPSAGVSGASP